MQNHTQLKGSPKYTSHPKLTRNLQSCKVWTDNDTFWMIKQKKHWTTQIISENVIVIVFGKVMISSNWVVQSKHWILRWWHLWYYKSWTIKLKIMNHFVLMSKNLGRNQLILHAAEVIWLSQNVDWFINGF